MAGSARLLWRGSLLPLGCEAAPTPATAHRIHRFTTATPWRGSAGASKLSRHKSSLAAGVALNRASTPWPE
ncbi:hypothetical protein C1X35_28280 [Pseudomonas sp. FW306-1C-G01A]|nr:hypothetical protein C1X56_17475 [Pseudomonas sp. GW101-1A09]PMV91087.1 hypothetical protein C1X51_22350 [Pseudomonas sp. FW306-2-2C-B10A]PMV96856.1 hypothetical protein C1X55_18050 [Pseudomonas sp. GW460-C8]PMW07406.1 hypothetical protein C1X50_04670 [Pseudomonas sp. MPR-TSA4]PMW13759.1 hypothetical protein C1X52_16840 [Pseudomonas sp. FW306-2-1A-C05A]PMW20203.1 hypothetical protein C1X40_11790 [Pseudomonas sp. GW456-11-11-14-TSB2]PMW20735.1 hypothetical protein C1X53_17190 [Pseudomonas s